MLEGTQELGSFKSHEVSLLFQTKLATYHNYFKKVILSELEEEKKDPGFKNPETLWIDFRLMPQTSEELI